MKRTGAGSEYGGTPSSCRKGEFVAAGEVAPSAFAVTWTSVDCFVSASFSMS